VLLAVVAFGVAWSKLRVPERHHGLRVDVAVRTLYADTWELFYDDSSFSYSGLRRVSVDVKPSTGVQHVVFELPDSVRRVQGIRLDPGKAAVDLRLTSISFTGPYNTVQVDADSLPHLFEAMHDVKPLELDSVHHEVLLQCTGDDPYLANARNLSPYTARALDPMRPVVRPFVVAIAVALLVGLIATLLARWRPSASVATAPRSGIRFQPRLLWLGLLLAGAAFLLAQGLANNVNFTDRALVVELEVEATHADNFQVFYADKPGGFSEGYYVNAPVGATDKPQLLSFRMPADTLFKYLRIDFGDKQRALHLRRLMLRCNDETHTYTAEELFDMFRPNPEVQRFDKGKDALELEFDGNDPFIFSDVDMGSVVKHLWERSGNGPQPMWFGLIVAVMVLASVVTNERLPQVLAHGRAVEWATVVVFCAMIALPMLGEWLPIQPRIADTEKRPLAPEPLLRAHSLLDYPSRYNRYYGDHFAFRKPLFRWNSLFYTYALHTSSMPDNAVFGKDGYLFLI
ncbi:MAG TPA: hypothetical protein VHL57_01405, partial [Flavobacteriales bacterium]|nr:hypothetical protein [Flavobacteriales bacterium]